MHGLRLALALGIVLLPGRALAHPDIDEGRRLAQSAELERAMEAFDRAEASGALSREDRIALLEGRALVYHALADDAALSRTLDALVALAPAHVMGRDIPPALRERFESSRERAAAEARVSGARPTGAPADRATSREPAPAVIEPTVSEGSGVEEPASTAPSAAEAAGAAEASNEPPALHAPLEDPGEDGGLGPWPFVGAAALVLAVGAAVAIYFLVPGSSTQPSFPRHPL